jgi:hypothetical protein
MGGFGRKKHATESAWLDSATRTAECITSGRLFFVNIQWILFLSSIIVVFYLRRGPLIVGTPCMHVLSTFLLGRASGIIEYIYDKCMLMVKRLFSSSWRRARRESHRAARGKIAVSGDKKVHSAVQCIFVAGITFWTPNFDTWPWRPFWTTKSRMVSLRRFHFHQTN